MNDPFLDKYSILDKIGEGSFSEVLKVKELRTGLKFAAKRLTKPYLNLDDVMKCTEIRTIKNLEFHPNVVGIVDIIYDDVTGNLTLIFELMDMSLYDYIKNRKRNLSEIRVKNYFYQLACGVHHLHKNGIFHRDIKPENILIKISRSIKNTPQMAEQIKLADLGSVCDMYNIPPHSSYISTRWYRAPECLLTSGHYSAKMDIWALGCVFYEMLTLNPLFPGENELDQLMRIHDVLGSPSQALLTKFKHKNVSYAFPKRKTLGFHTLVPMLSEYGIAVLTKTLAYHPDSRISINQLLEHVYFSDFRSKKLQTNFSSTPFLIPKCNSTKSLIFKESIQSENKPKQDSNRSSRGSSEFSSKSHNELSSLNNKTLERAWGMNSGPGKKKILNNLKKTPVKIKL